MQNCMIVTPKSCVRVSYERDAYSPPPLGGNLSRVFLYLAGIYAQFSWARSLELSHSDVGTEVVIQTLILQKKCGVEL